MSSSYVFINGNELVYGTIFTFNICSFSIYLIIFLNTIFWHWIKPFFTHFIY